MAGASPPPRSVLDSSLYYEPEEDGPSFIEEADTMLVQMRELREQLQLESGALHQMADAAERERTAAQQNLGRTLASIIDEVASAPSLVLDVANGQRINDPDLADRLAQLRPAAADSPGSSPAAVRAAASSTAAAALAGAELPGPSECHQHESTLAASSSPPPSSPPRRNGKAPAPRFGAKAGGAAAARADHLAKVRGAPALPPGTGVASTISGLANRPLLPPAEPGAAGGMLRTAKGAPRRVAP